MIPLLLNLLCGTCSGLGCVRSYPSSLSPARAAHLLVAPLPSSTTSPSREVMVLFFLSDLCSGSQRSGYLSTNSFFSSPPPPAQVADMRISYERGGLQEADFAGRDPLQVFDEWFKAAVSGKVRRRRRHTCERRGTGCGCGCGCARNRRLAERGTGSRERTAARRRGPDGLPPVP